MNLKKILMTGTAILVMGFSAPAMADELINRLDHIERQIQTMSRAVYRGEATSDASGTMTPLPLSPSGNQPSSSAAIIQMEQRLVQIENDLRKLRGALEQQGNSISVVKRQMDQRVANIEKRVGEMERVEKARPSFTSVSNPDEYNQKPTNNNHSSIQVHKPQDVAPAAAPQVSASEQKDSVQAVLGGGTDASSMYNSAFGMLRQGQYKNAAGGLTAFLAKYPDHSLSDNAIYWLGETYYARNMFGKASQTFAKAYQKSPKGAKAQDNLLKLGMSLSNSGKTKEACLAFGQLKKDFASDTGAVARRAEQEAKRIGCQ